MGLICVFVVERDLVIVVVAVLIILSIWFQFTSVFDKYALLQYNFLLNLVINH